MDEDEDKGKKRKKRKRPTTKTFEEAAASLMERFPSRMDVEYADTGSLVLNKLMGGGLPRGKYVELSTPSGMGKSTAALHICLSLCENGEKCVYLDFENAVNDSLVHGVGLTPYIGKTFSLHKLMTFADAEDAIDPYLYSGDIALIVIDSITAIIPSVIQETSIEAALPGLKARLQGALLEKYKSDFSINGTTLLLINQMRTKFDFRGNSRVGPAGGMTLEFYSDVRLMGIGAGKKIEENIDGKKVIIGHDMRLTTIKNKFTKPFVEDVLSVLFGKGISNIRTMMYYLVNEKIVKQSGSYFEIEGSAERMRGWVGVEAYVRENFEECLQKLKGLGIF